jgi:hypothetical protein
MMKLKTEFKQGNLIAKDSLGICMRATFKWSALKVVGGAFRYAKLNVGKTEKKMAAYGDPFIKKLCDKSFSALDPQQSQGYINDDIDSIKKFATLWGGKLVDANKTTFTGVTAKDGQAITSLADYYKSASVAWGTFHAIYSFYMKIPAQALENVLGTAGKNLTIGLARVEDNTRTIMVGHVVGISGSDSTFFDANQGEFEFDTSDPIKIVADIEAHVTKIYNPEKTFKRGIILLGK